MRIEPLLFCAHVGLYGYYHARAHWRIARDTSFYRVAEIENELGFRLFDRSRNWRSAVGWQPANSLAVAWLTAAAEVLRKWNELDVIAAPFLDGRKRRTDHLESEDLVELMASRRPRDTQYRKRIEAWLGFAVWAGAAHTAYYQAVEGYVRELCNSLSNLLLLTRRLRERIEPPP